MRQFWAQGLHKTEHRTGVLIFASAAERYAEIVADAGINEKVTPEVWERAIRGAHLGDQARPAGRRLRRRDRRMRRGAGRALPARRHEEGRAAGQAGGDLSDLPAANLQGSTGAACGWSRIATRNRASRRASRSTFSPAGSISRASSGSRPTAMSSSPRARRGSRQGPAAGRRRRCRATGCVRARLARAVRHRVLSRRRPAMGLCGEYGFRGPLPLSVGRHEGARTRRDDRRPSFPSGGRPLDARHRVLARRHAHVRVGRFGLERRGGHGQARSGGAGGVARRPTARRGLGTGSRAGGRSGVRSAGQEPPHLRHRHPQLRRHGGQSRGRRPVVLDQRARRHRRQYAARLRHAREGGRVLRLALVLHRRRTRTRATRASGPTSRTRSPCRTC